MILTMGHNGHQREALSLLSSETEKIFVAMVTNGQNSHMSMVSELCTLTPPSVASVLQHWSSLLGSWCLQIPSRLGIGIQIVQS